MAFFAFKNGPRGATVSETFLFRLQELFKTAPSAPTLLPRGSQDGPKGVQEAAKRGPRGPKRPPRWSQDAPRRGLCGLQGSPTGQKRPHRGCRGFQVLARTAPRGIKRGPGGSQRALRAAKELPEAPKRLLEDLQAVPERSQMMMIVRIMMNLSNKCQKFIRSLGAGRLDYSSSFCLQTPCHGEGCILFSIRFLVVFDRGA